MLNTRWQFGQCSRERFVIPNRNGFANIRMQASSKVRVIIFSLVNVPRILGQDMETVVDGLQKLTLEEGELLVKNNAVYEVELEPWSVLYTPPGVICLEETVAGHLNFGLKIPFIQRTEEFVKAYGKAAELTEAAGKTSSKKMMEVVAFLSESSAAASG